MGSSGSSNFKNPAMPTPSGPTSGYGATSAFDPAFVNVLSPNQFTSALPDDFRAQMNRSQAAAAVPRVDAVNPQIQIDMMRSEVAKMIADSQAKQAAAAGKAMQQQQMYARAGGGGYAGFGGGRSSSNGYGGSARGGPGGFGGSSARGGRAY